MEGGGEGAVADGSVSNIREGGEDGEDYDDDEEFDDGETLLSILAHDTFTLLLFKLSY